EVVEQAVFGRRIQAGRRLVEDEQQRLFAHHRAAKRDLLPLPERQVHAARELPAELRIQASRQRRLQIRRRGPFQRADERRVNLDLVGLTDAYRFTCHQLQGGEVLKARCQPPPPFIDRQG